MAAAEAEGDKAEEEVKRQEHDVSIVLSYMDDEHEKAAIEVRPLARAPRPRALAPILTEADAFVFG